MQMLTTPVGSASSWGLCYNNIIMARDHFSQAMRSPRFHTDAYQESKEAEYEQRLESFLLNFAKRARSAFIFSKFWK